MMYDDLLKKIGEFGWYQKRIFAVTCMQPITSGLGMFIFYRCAIPGYKNDTYHQQNDYHGYLINQSIPQSSSCLIRNTTVDKYGNVTSLEYKCSSWVYDTSIFTSTFVTEFDMVCDNAVLESNAVMILFLGLLLGYGLLGVEFVGPSKRRYTDVISNLTWCLGLFMISLFGYLIRNWRYLHLTAAIFSTHLLFFFLYFGIMLNLESLVGDIYLNLVLATIVEASCYMY
ncbi:organic cation transporter protein-like [Patella vulgata]|uniref:organic cation transporter protein-like n=1 Tax=Patella vulgata TaxID=6465 RepID=UPI0024A938B6|nr:organic cation transporter protein-like [Patella vulgata]